MNTCLYCRLSPVWPEEPAGLCVSCRASVARGEVAVLAVGGCVILESREGGSMARQLYSPEEHGADVGIQADMRSQLLTLALDSRPKRIHLQARGVIDELRACGLIVAYHVGLAVAYIDRPRAAPYLLLVRFLELQPEIADELTRESANVRCEQNVQLEHLTHHPGDIPRIEATHHDNAHYMPTLQTG